MQQNLHTRRPPRGAFLLGAIAIACVVGASAQAQEPAPALSVLTLNLHGYQELQTAGTAETDLTFAQATERIERYDPILERIAAGIEALDPDIMCFQEVVEWAGTGHGDPKAVEFGRADTNIVRQILSRLDDEWHYTMDWSHYGWNVWLEGSAIVSRFPIDASDSRFVSRTGAGYDSWKTRKVPMAKLDVPGIGDVAVFSVHTGWWDDPDEPAKEQFARLLDWAQEVDSTTTVFCGDFNAPADGPGYRFLTTGTGLSDPYLAANPDGMSDATIGGGADGWAGSEGERIDYIFVNESSPLAVITARRVFTDDDFGRVSDHVGVFAEFGLAEQTEPRAQ